VLVIGVTFRHYLGEIALDLGVDDFGRFPLKGTKSPAEGGGNIQLLKPDSGG